MKVDRKASYEFFKIAQDWSTLSVLSPAGKIKQ